MQGENNMSYIPFNRASLAGKEHEYIQEAVDRMHISGDGPFSKKCQSLLENELGCTKALLTTSCTHALEMAAILLDIRPGDEVIAPSFTFPSTVNPFVLRGARPVFCDIRPDTLNIDENQLESLITKRTKAIIPVHYAGVGCEMDVIMNIAEKHGVPVVEDNAHGLFGKYNGKALGSFGCMAAQSFHETKNVSCGEGGALIINDPALVDRAEIIREKGTDRSRFFRGQVDKYTWVDVGSSYPPSDILAAFLLAQLEKRKEIQAARQKVWRHYSDGLQTWATKNNVLPPQVPEKCAQSYHMFYLRTPSRGLRDSLINHLKNLNILAVFHYLPLHLSRMGRGFGGRPGDCPVTEKISDMVVRLPFYNDLSHDLQNRVIEGVKSFPM